jgi:hypothetical protein
MLKYPAGVLRQNPGEESGENISDEPPGSGETAARRAGIISAAKRAVNVKWPVGSGFQGASSCIVQGGVKCSRNDRSFAEDSPTRSRRD